MIPIYNWIQYIKSTWDLVQVVAFNVVRIRTSEWWIDGVVKMVVWSDLVIKFFNL
jgi:hypothetical protein